MNQPAPDPKQQKVVKVKMTGEFLEEARRRGVTPEEFTTRIFALFTVMEEEGQELFEDWGQWTREQRKDWIGLGAWERAKLELPYPEY